jgi:hypothetical protein
VDFYPFCHFGNCISFIGPGYSKLEDCRDADRYYEYYFLAVKRAADYSSDNLVQWCNFARPSAIKKSEIQVDSIKLKLNKLITDSYNKDIEWINRVKQESKRINSNLATNIWDLKRYHCLTDKNNVSSIETMIDYYYREIETYFNTLKRIISIILLIF